MGDRSYSGTSSVCSNMSDVSVTMDGQEYELEEAVDHIFQELQHYINQMHVEIRTITQWDLNDQDYDEVKPFFDNLCSHIKEGNSLFKDLQKVIKQVLPPKPKALKSIKE